MARRIRNHIRSNIYGLVAIFLALREECDRSRKPSNLEVRHEAL